MNNLTIKQLRYFEALIEHGHFGRAAEASAISQPALSMQIKELEDNVGSVLFERSARQIRLTGFGEQFATRARLVLRTLEELDEFTQSVKEGAIGRLRLGVIPTIAPYMLPSIIYELTAKYPGIDIHVRETQTERLVQELAAGKLDMALVALPVSEPSFTEMPLFSEEFLLVRHKSDAEKEVPDRSSLSEMKLLLLEEGHCFRDQALSFCNRKSALSNDGLDGSSLSTLVQMVGAGIGVTLIPEMAANIETRSADVCTARLLEPRPIRTLGMVWRKTNPHCEIYITIAETIKKAAQTKKADV